MIVRHQNLARHASLKFLKCRLLARKRSVAIVGQLGEREVDEAMGWAVPSNPVG